MNTTLPIELLGGLSPTTFMRRHWQKKPLLVRQAIPGGVELISRSGLFDLAASDLVESRLVAFQAGRWSLRQGPIKRSSIRSLRLQQWTLLVQGLELRVPAARRLLERFRFAPDARLDDLMVSYATAGGGVGAHVDSYDVFLLQAQGQRRWRIGRSRQPELVPNLPLKILSNFEPEHDWLLEPGDMLYLPPGWAHEGVAHGESMTCSIGFRAPDRQEIGREVLHRLLDVETPASAATLYRDAAQEATARPARIPLALRRFAADAVARMVSDRAGLACALGEWLTEPKRGVWFDAAEGMDAPKYAALALDPRSRMMYDDRHVYINGESFRAGGRDGRLMRVLADRRVLRAAELEHLSEEAREVVRNWLAAGWLQAEAAEGVRKMGMKE